MNFVSPADLAKHLRALVDDEDFILRTVRVHFPEYKKEVREAEKVRRAITKEEQARALASDPESFVFDSGRDRSALAQTSDELWKAIHREHPQIMKRLYHLGKTRRAHGQHGPVVVYP